MSLKEARAFFRKHSGVVDPETRERSACHLADAEAWADEVGVRFLWANESCRPDRELAEGSEWLAVTAVLEDEVLASCGGIEMAPPSRAGRDPYFRIMEGQMASEAWDRWRLCEDAKHRATNAIIAAEDLVERFQCDVDDLTVGRDPRDGTHKAMLIDAYVNALRFQLREAAGFKP